MKTLLIPLTAMVFVLAASAQDKTAKTGAAAYGNFVEPWRSGFVKAWEKHVAAAREDVETAKRDAEGAKDRARSLEDQAEQARIRLKKTRGENNVRAAKRVVAKAEAEAAQAVRNHEERLRYLRSAEERLAQREKNDPPLMELPTLGPLGTWRVGDYGRCNGRPRILQVVGKDRLLLVEGGSIVSLRVPTTANLVDDRPIALDDHLIHVTGTISYTAVSGAKRTVLAAEVVSPDSIRKK